MPGTTSWSALSLLAAAVLLGTGCSRAVPNRNPVGETFPRIESKSLDGRSITLPDDLRGEPVLLLVAYKQETQFDVDRWLLGLQFTETPVRVYELPTIKGAVPGLFANKIDQGMRGGIPDLDENIVVTVYKKDAARIVDLTGNQENEYSARALLLDGSGKIVWFHDEGFSARVMEELDTKVRQMK